MSNEIETLDLTNDDDGEPIAEPAPAPTPEPPVQKDLPQVDLTVYLTASRSRPDQTAGFRRWALSRRLGKRTIPEWTELWNEFQRRPTK